MRPRCVGSAIGTTGTDFADTRGWPMNARYRARRLPFDVPELAVVRVPPDGARRKWDKRAVRMGPYLRYR